MAISTRSLSPGFGLEISGIDFSTPFCESIAEELRQAWVDAHGLLLIRNQVLTPEQHIAIGAALGTVYSEGAKNNTALANYYLPGYPQIFRVSNKRKDGVAQGREDAGTYWHSDGSWQQNPPRGSLLYALELPSVGGDTVFADMHQAYEALSPAMQKLFDGLEAQHSLAAAVMRTSYAKEYQGRLDEALAKAAVHPVVKPHPVSGKKALFVNPGFTGRILGVSQRESDALLSLLFEHCVANERTYRHTWQLHDLLIWDNFSNLHYAVANYKSHGDRYMHRVTVRLP